MSSSLSIEGKVIDLNNEALPGALVFVDGEGIKTPISTVTGSDGHFELRDLPPPGQYLLSVTMEGFMDWKKTVVVSPDRTFIANITMYPE